MSTTIKNSYPNPYPKLRDDQYNATLAKVQSMWADRTKDRVLNRADVAALTQATKTKEGSLDSEAAKWLGGQLDPYVSSFDRVPAASAPKGSTLATTPEARTDIRNFLVNNQIPVGKELQYQLNAIKLGWPYFNAAPYKDLRSLSPFIKCDPPSPDVLARCTATNIPGYKRATFGSGLNLDRPSQLDVYWDASTISNQANGDLARGATFYVKSTGPNNTTEWHTINSKDIDLLPREVLSLIGAGG